MPSSRLLKKKLSVHRIADNKSCVLNLQGCPIKCPSSRQNPSTIIESFNKTSPELIAVQIDPMPFIYKARQWAIAHLPFVTNT